MTIDQQERINRLCMQIQVENDRYKFNQLVHELNELLAKKVQSLPFEQMNDGAKSETASQVSERRWFT